MEFFKEKWLTSQPQATNTHCLIWLAMQETYAFLKMHESHNELKQREQ